MLASDEATWDSVLGLWSTIGNKQLKHYTRSGDWDEAKFVDRADHRGDAGDDEETFTVWHSRGWILVAGLACNFDEDYEEGRKLIEREPPCPDTCRPAAPTTHPKVRASLILRARHEEALIASCLEALAEQHGVSPKEYDVLLVLDRCMDAIKDRASEVAA